MADYNSIHTGAAIDAAITKVAGIEAGADVTDTANVTAAGALMDSELADIAAIKALNQGVATTDSPLFTNTEFAAIAATIAATAVDVFVYDTSKDSDGGAWRKRTQHTSWYNETLNTATRGSRREFPAVAVIVAESNKVTIYDGDDPALPMWMVFENNANDMFRGFSAYTSIAAMNGKMVGGTSSVGFAQVDFLSDSGFLHEASGVRAYYGSISQRNDGLGQPTTGVGTGIVNATVNDVAMTVLPNAPIDAATGLPVPTIAVATGTTSNQAGSIIKDDGTVVNVSNFVGNNAHLYEHVEFADDGTVWWARDYYLSGYAVYINTTIEGSFIQAYGSSFVYGITEAIPTLIDASTSNVPQIKAISSNGNAVGQTVGLNRFYYDENQDRSSVAHITSSYNTGWMNGDIKGAFLSSTDATSLVGSGELVTSFTNNSTFPFETFTASGNSISSAVNSSGFGIAYAAVSLTAGKTYLVSGNVTLNSGAAPDLRTGTTNNTLPDVVAVAVNGSFAFTITPTLPTSYVGFRVGDGVATNFSATLSVKLADADRSVNNNGLIVNGTVTRTAVATGADLVAYSGWSASNYLEQAYNADLDFGTGDFAIIGWLKQAANTAVETILERDSAVSAQRFTLAVNASGFLTFTCDDDTTARTATSNRVVDNDVWTHFVALYDGAGDVKIYLNGALDDTETGSALLTLNNASAVLSVGLAVDGAEPLTNGSLALLRISATASTADQIAKIYEDEKVLFQENAACTLYGASDAVSALAHDSVTDLLHVGTSAGRSVFSGLRRVSNTETAVETAISASNGLVVEE